MKSERKKRHKTRRQNSNSVPNIQSLKIVKMREIVAKEAQHKHNEKKTKVNDKRRAIEKATDHETMAK